MPTILTSLTQHGLRSTLSTLFHPSATISEQSHSRRRHQYVCIRRRSELDGRKMRAAAYRLLDTGGSAEEEACRTYLRVDDGHQRDEGEREEIVLGKKHIGDKRREGRVRRGRRRGRGKKDEFAGLERGGGDGNARHRRADRSRGDGTNAQRRISRNDEESGRRSRSSSGSSPERVASLHQLPRRASDRPSNRRNDGHLRSRGEGSVNPLNSSHKDEEGTKSPFSQPRMSAVESRKFVFGSTPDLNVGVAVGSGTTAPKTAKTTHSLQPRDSPVPLAQQGVGSTHSHTPRRSDSAASAVAAQKESLASAVGKARRGKRTQDDQQEDADDVAEAL